MNTSIKIKHVLFAALAGLLLITACNKEEDPFTGKDNYVASFSLKQGETVWNAAIADNVITVKAPEGLSLNGAAATVKLSENAEIYPDPSTITDWDDETMFTVTAYNGTQIRYKYTVVRSSIDEKGTVLLETQADVDAFGQRGITAIGGNLLIGRATGADSITSLAPLATLKEVAYSLIINMTFAGTDLTGLENLEKVGGDLHMGNTDNSRGLPHLAAVALPKLKTADDIHIHSETLFGNVEFPALTAVAKTLTLNCPMAEMHFPNLKTVGGSLTITKTVRSGKLNSMITAISFPALEEAGDISFNQLENVAKIELPELKKAGGMTFGSSAMTMLSAIMAPKLEVASGTIALPITPNFTEVSFPSLTQVGELITTSNIINVLDLPKLKTVAGRLYIRSMKIDGIEGLASLESVEGELSISGLSQMTELVFPPKLKRVATLTISISKTDPVVPEIDVRGIDIGNLNLQANAMKAKIIGDDVFRGTLTITSAGATGGSEFPVLEGFHEVDSLSIARVTITSNVHIRGIRKIRGFQLAANSTVKSFSMPDLEEIGGNFTLSTGSAAGSMESVQFPALKTIGGKMLLQGNGTAANNRLTNLDGFATLSSVQSIEIKYQGALVSFEGLKEAFKSINAAGWSATNNNYNPTYDDLQAGKWVKP